MLCGCCDVVVRCVCMVCVVVVCVMLFVLLWCDVLWCVAVVSCLPLRLVGLLCV